MEKNKSIDGLVVRRTSKNASATKNISSSHKVITERQTIKQEVKPVTIKRRVVPITKKIEVTEKKEATVDPEKIREDFLKPITAFDFEEKETAEPKVEEKDDDMNLELLPKNKKEIKKQNKLNKKAIKKEKKQKKKVSKARKIITSILLVVVAILIGGVIWLIVWGNDIISKITGGRSTILDVFTFMDENYDPLKEDENGRTNILAFGTSGYNMDGDEGDGTHDGAQLTDSIMAISIDQHTGDIAMISLPRDLKASPTCTATGKINEVYWCNNMYGETEEEGAQALMDEVSDVLGINFQYYAHVNWESLIDVVDTIGGITVTTDETIEYDYTGYDGENVVDMIWENNPTEMSGRAALGLARARHVTQMGDFSRGNSQQRILIGIKDKIYSANLSFDTLFNLVSVLGDNLRTNFSLSEIKTTIHLTYEYDFDSMRQISLVDYDEGIYYFSTGMINNISYVIPSAGVGNYSAIHNYVANLLISDPIIREDAEILILNGTDTSGVASAEKELLEADNYNVSGIDDTDKYENKYTIYKISDGAEYTIKALEERYGVSANTELPDGVDWDYYYDIVIVLGGESTTE